MNPWKIAAASFCIAFNLIALGANDPVFIANGVVLAFWGYMLARWRHE